MQWTYPIPAGYRGESTVFPLSELAKSPMQFLKNMFDLLFNKRTTTRERSFQNAKILEHQPSLHYHLITLDLWIFYLKCTASDGKNIWISIRLFTYGSFFFLPCFYFIASHLLLKGWVLWSAEKVKTIGNFRKTSIQRRNYDTRERWRMKGF